MKSQDIRKKFTSYFEKRGHKLFKSSPLLQTGDPTLLFTNAGMNQFKDVFLGIQHLPFKNSLQCSKMLKGWRQAQ